MKKYTNTLFLILTITTLLNTTSMQGMQSDNIFKEAHEYNEKRLPTHDIFKIPLKTIFYYCQNQADLSYLPESERNTYTLSLITYYHIENLLALSRTCKCFHEIMPFKEIINFCKTLPSEIKDLTLGGTIPNISKNYNDINYQSMMLIPKVNDNHDNNLICLALIYAGADTNMRYEVTELRTLNTINLSVLSQAIDGKVPFLINAALKHGAEATHWQRELIKKVHGVIPLATDNKNQSLSMQLSMVIQKGNLYQVKCFMEKQRIDPIAPPHIDHSTPLYRACRYGHLPIIEYLLEQGAHINEYYEKEGMTPFHVAIKTKNLNVVRFLASRGADIYLPVTNEESAANFGDENIALFLSTLEQRPLTSTTCENRIQITQNQNFEDLILLLKNKHININEQNASGNTLLILAAMKQDSKMMRLLLQHGADKNICNNDGYTALDIAFHNQDNDLADLLTESEA